MKILSVLVVAFLSLSAQAQLKIAIIDSGLDLSDTKLTSHICTDGYKDFTSSSVNDTFGHGTKIATLIEQYASKADYCIYILKYWKKDLTNEQHMKNSNAAFKYAFDVLKVDVINFSSNGEKFDETEFNLIKSHHKVKVFVSSGNDGLNLDTNKSYPASYGLSNIVVVGSVDENGSKSYFSNYGKVVTQWEKGNNVSYKGKTIRGTSFSTAIATGKYISTCRGLVCNRRGTGSVEQWSH